MTEKLSFTLALRAIEEVAEEIDQKQDVILDLKEKRDDMIRDALKAEMPKTVVSRAAGLSVEQIRNIEGYRYSRESRRKKPKKTGPERD
jgi:hypothetical protein